MTPAITNKKLKSQRRVQCNHNTLGTAKSIPRHTLPTPSSYMPATQAHIVPLRKRLCAGLQDAHWFELVPMHVAQVRSHGRHGVPSLESNILQHRIVTATTTTATTPRARTKNMKGKACDSGVPLSSISPPELSTTKHNCDCSLVWTLQRCWTCWLMCTRARHPCRRHITG